MSEQKLAALIILDGFALRDEEKGNAVKQAHTPNFDRYWYKFPHTQLQAYGEAVGLPDGQIGSSEVGNLIIADGRIADQILTRSNMSIEKGEFCEKVAFLQAMRKAKKSNKALHIFCLLSDGGVHSDIHHLFALLKLASDEGLP